MKFFLLPFILFVAVHPLFATDYYVSPLGNDSNPGTQGSPWQTLQYSVDQLQPGDLLSVQPGNYPEKITLHVSGTSVNPIRIVGVNYPIIDGSGLFSQTALIAIVDQSYIEINGLELQENVMNDAQGILVDGNCQGISIVNNRIHDIHFSANPNDVATETTNAQAIIVFGSNATTAIDGLTIEQNQVYNCRLGYSEGIAVNGNVTNFSVSYNTVYALTNIGIVAIGHEGTCADPLVDQARNGIIRKNHVYDCHSPYAACAGIYIDGAKDIMVEQNAAHDNDYGIEIGCEHPGKTASGVHVRNNIVRFNAITGIALGGYDYPTNSGSVVNTTVYNNTLFKNDSLYDGNGELTMSYSENCFVENNIFYTNHQLRAVTVTDTVVGLHVNYNLYYNETSDQTNMIETITGTYTLADFQSLNQENNGLFADPLFQLSTIDDWSFSMGFNFSSPVVDAGNPMLGTLEVGSTDYFNNNRLWGPTVDIGASELWAEELSESLLSSVVISPNPTLGSVTIQSPVVYERFKVFHLAGKLELEGTVDQQRICLDSLSNGTYLVYFYGEQEGVAQSRVVKLTE